ncbi:hypothetical protein [uncultured Dietzia sp.]|uniref:hypothetical protein n=1 Tax=uncultured Dietzia sp. TaxID=395519 RepID=UPI0025F05141|nr:hypothetical protein [uncultured Dietzia sp.]
MSESLVHFLLVYSFDERRLIRQDEFTETKAAVAAYEDMEARYRNTNNVDRFEIVLVGADSIDTVMRTHGHYFQDADEAMFADLLASH